MLRRERYYIRRYITPEYVEPLLSADVCILQRLSRHYSHVAASLLQ